MMCGDDASSNSSTSSTPPSQQEHPSSRSDEADHDTAESAARADASSGIEESFGKTEVGEEKVEIAQQGDSCATTNNLNSSSLAEPDSNRITNFTAKSEILPFEEQKKPAAAKVAVAAAAAEQDKQRQIPATEPAKRSSTVATASQIHASSAYHRHASSVPPFFEEDIPHRHSTEDDATQKEDLAPSASIQGTGNQKESAAPQPSSSVSGLQPITTFNMPGAYAVRSFRASPSTSSSAPPTGTANRVQQQQQQEEDEENVTRGSPDEDQPQTRPQDVEILLTEHDNTAPAVIGESVVVVTGNEMLGNSSHHGDPEEPPTAAQEDHITPTMELVEAKPMEDESKRARRGRCLFLLLLLFLGAGFAIALAFIFGPRSNNDKQVSSSQGTQETPSQQLCTGDGSMVICPPFQDNLPLGGLKEIEKVGSMFYLGNRWMLDDPNLASYSEIRQRQRFLLACLYYGTNGDYWLNNTNWLSYSVSECNWFYHTVEADMKQIPICDENDNLVSIGLSSNNLQGFFPLMTPFRSKSFLPEVIALDLSHNNISGALPMLMDSYKLQIAVVSNNSFEQPGLGFGVSLDSPLRILKTDSNRIQANLQGLVFPLLRNLEFYNGTGNRYEGIFASTIGLLRNLTYFGFGHNAFAGTLPTELGLLRALREIDVSSTRLFGTLPSELSGLSQLTHLDLTDTLVTGPIPEALCTTGAASDDNTRATVEILVNCSVAECCDAPEL